MVIPNPARLQSSLIYNREPLSVASPIVPPFNYNGLRSPPVTPLPSFMRSTPSRVGLSPVGAIRAPSALEMERELLLARVRVLNQELASSTMALSSLSTLSPSLTTNMRIPTSPLHARRPSAHMLALADEKRLWTRTLKQEQDARKKASQRKPTPDEAWDSMFKALAHYRLKRGDCLVKEKENPRLGRWVRNQRNRKKQGLLSQDRVIRLDSIGFVWSLVQQESWEAMFARLVAYRKKHGNCLVPRSYKNDPKLGRWVDTQRNKNRNDMSEERMKQLEDIGFVWQVHKQTWDSMYERLVKFKEEHGDCLVPSVHDKDPKLGTWVHVQRARKGMLSEERKKRLDEIGFCWCIFQKGN